jgi:ABC-type glutathione transport system ATPase component
VTEALLDIEDLRVTFTGRGREVRAVDGVTYSVYAGQTLAIVGESGSGKTVSCRALMGSCRPARRSPVRRASRAPNSSG